MTKVYEYSALTPTDDLLCDYVIPDDPNEQLSVQPDQDLSELVGKHIMLNLRQWLALRVLVP